MPAPEAESLLGILGGTEKFRKARGQALLVITPEGDIDSTFPTLSLTRRRDTWRRRVHSRVKSSPRNHRLWVSGIIDGKFTLGFLSP